MRRAAGSAGRHDRRRAASTPPPRPAARLTAPLRRHAGRRPVADPGPSRRTAAQRRRRRPQLPLVRPLLPRPATSTRSSPTRSSCRCRIRARRRLLVRELLAGRPTGSRRRCAPRSRQGTKLSVDVRAGAGRRGAGRPRRPSRAQRRRRPTGRRCRRSSSGPLAPAARRLRGADHRPAGRSACPASAPMQPSCSLAAVLDPDGARDALARRLRASTSAALARHRQGNGDLRRARRSPTSSRRGVSLDSARVAGAVAGPPIGLRDAPGRRRAGVRPAHRHRRSPRRRWDRSGAVLDVDRSAGLGHGQDGVGGAHAGRGDAPARDRRRPHRGGRRRDGARIALVVAPRRRGRASASAASSGRRHAPRRAPAPRREHARSTCRDVAWADADTAGGRSAAAGASSRCSRFSSTSASTRLRSGRCPEDP